MSEDGGANGRRWYDPNKVVLGLIAFLVAALMAAASWNVSRISALETRIQAAEVNSAGDRTDIKYIKESVERIERKLNR